MELVKTRTDVIIDGLLGKVGRHDSGCAVFAALADESQFASLVLKCCLAGEWRNFFLRTCIP